VELLAGLGKPTDPKLNRIWSKNPTLGEYWHAFRVDGDPTSMVSMCFVVIPAETPTNRWDDRGLEPRCYSCTSRIDDPKGPDTIWWRSHDPAHRGHCVVCRKSGTGGFLGSKAILYERQQHGLKESVSARPVLVHKDCAADGRVMSELQGFGWEYPAAPEWDNPRAQWRAPTPET
jgi:hypothetical protein